jgi:hypothetical protein
MTDIKVQAKHALLHGPEDFGPDRLYWVRGVCFTSDDAALTHFRKVGLTLTEIPDPGPARVAWLDEQASYLLKVEQLKAEAARVGYRGPLAIQDGADAPRFNYSAGL